MLNFIKGFTAFGTHPHFFFFLQPLMPDPNRGITFIAYRHGIGHMNRPFFFNNSTLLVLLRGTGMTLDHINLFHNDPIPDRINPENLSALPFLFPGHHLNNIVSLD